MDLDTDAIVETLLDTGSFEEGESVYVQVAGEYGHLTVDALRDFRVE